MSITDCRAALAAAFDLSPAHLVNPNALLPRNGRAVARTGRILAAALCVNGGVTPATIAALLGYASGSSARDAAQRGLTARRKGGAPAERYAAARAALLREEPIHG